MSGENNNNAGVSKVPFEVALNKAGFGLYSYILTLFTGLSIISFACILYNSTIIVQISACELETTTAQQGLLVAGPVVGGILGASLWGYLADTRGRRSMLLVSFMTAAICNGIASLSVHWIMLLTVQFISSLLAAGQYSIVMTLLSECVPAVKRNLVILVVASIFLLSQGVMSLIALPIISLDFSFYLSTLGIYWNTWRTVVVVYSIPSLICFAWMWFMKESPKFEFSKGNEEEAINILRSIHDMNRGKSKEEFQVKGLLIEEQDSGNKSSKQSSAELFRMPLFKNFIIMTTLSMFSFVGAFILWLPKIANEFVQIIRTGEGRNFTLCQIISTGNENQDDANLVSCSLDETALLIVFGVGCLQSVFNLILSLGVNILGRRNIGIAVASICGVSGIITNFIPNAVGSAVLFLIFLMGMVVLGLYTAMSVAFFPTHLRALAVALTATGGRISLFVVVQILNILLENNCNLGFILFATLFTSSAVIMSFLPDDRFIGKPQQVPNIEQEKETPQDDHAEIK